MPPSHDEAPAMEYVPAAHVAHTVAPVTPPYLPGGQSVHAVAATAFE